VRARAILFFGSVGCIQRTWRGIMGRNIYLSMLEARAFWFKYIGATERPSLEDFELMLPRHKLHPVLGKLDPLYLPAFPEHKAHDPKAAAADLEKGMAGLGSGHMGLKYDPSKLLSGGLGVAIPANLLKNTLADAPPPQRPPFIVLNLRVRKIEAVAFDPVAEEEEHNINAQLAAGDTTKSVRRALLKSRKKLKDKAHLANARVKVTLEERLALITGRHRKWSNLINDREHAAKVAKKKEEWKKGHADEIAERKHQEHEALEAELAHAREMGIDIKGVETDEEDGDGSDFDSEIEVESSSSEDEFGHSTDEDERLPPEALQGPQCHHHAGPGRESVFKRVQCDKSWLVVTGLPQHELQPKHAKHIPAGHKSAGKSAGLKGMGGRFIMGPAQKAGMLLGDVLLSVAGMNARGRSIADVAHMFESAPTTFDVRVMRRNRAEEREAERQRKAEEARKRQLLEQRGGHALGAHLSNTDHGFHPDDDSNEARFERAVAALREANEGNDEYLPGQEFFHAYDDPNVMRHPESAAESNPSGFLTKGQFRQALARLWPAPLMKHEADMLANKFELHHDGWVHYQKFLGFAHRQWYPCSKHRRITCVECVTYGCCLKEIKHKGPCRCSGYKENPKLPGMCKCGHYKAMHRFDPAPRRDADFTFGRDVPGKELSAALLRRPDMSAKVDLDMEEKHGALVQAKRPPPPRPGPELVSEGEMAAELAHLLNPHSYALTDKFTPTIDFQKLTAAVFRNIAREVSYANMRSEMRAPTSLNPHDGVRPDWDDNTQDMLVNDDPKTALLDGFSAPKAPTTHLVNYGPEPSAITRDPDAVPGRDGLGMGLARPESRIEHVAGQTAGKYELGLKPERNAPKALGAFSRKPDEQLDAQAHMLHEATQNTKEEAGVMTAIIDSRDINRHEVRAEPH
jgi:hypothetical protein